MALRKGAVLLASALQLAGGSARAEPLRVDASRERMRVDGALNEWRGAHFAELGRGDDASARYALASADQGLYLGAEVRDDALSTGRPADALVLTLALPGRAGVEVSELWLFPGESGRSKARAQRGAEGRLDPRIQVVEGPRKGGRGYVLEAFVPWAAVPGAEIWDQARASLRLVDVDHRRVETTLATASAKSASELPRIVLGSGQNDLLGSFLEAQNLTSVEPRYDFRANVSGDVRPERVVVVDRYVVVYGPGYKGGAASGFFQLPFGVGGGLKTAALRDLTGDGRAELLATVRQQNALGVRELWLVLSLDEARLGPLFALELRKELSAGGVVESTLELVTAGQRVPRVDVRAGHAEGVDASSYREQSASDAQPILLPWGDIEARSYAFDGQRFAMVSEKKRAEKAVPGPAPAAHRVVEPGPLPPAPTAPSRTDVLALFRREHGLAASVAPTRSLRVNVLAGASEEFVDLFGNVLVLTGPEIANATAYVSYTVPVAEPKDVLELRAVDVTGDGAAELLVRTRQKLTGADDVVRELLWVVHGDAQGRLGRLLAVEVARRQGRQAIENRVVAQKGALVIEPGKATSWTAQSYPFTSQAIGGASRLLLPWSDRPVRYRLEGSALVPTL